MLHKEDAAVYTAAYAEIPGEGARAEDLYGEGECEE